MEITTMPSSQKVVVIAALAAAVGVLIGGLIGHFGTSTGPPLTEAQEEYLRTMDLMIADQWEQGLDTDNKFILESIDRQKMKEDLRILTEKPHLAATPRDVFLAKMIRDRWTEAGLDTVQMVPYTLLLSRPNVSNPNLVTWEDGSGATVFKSQYKEKVIREDDYDENFVHAFNAYTPAGDAMSEKGYGVVYVNYARVEDFDKLEELGVNVTGTVVIARYGKIFRGNKVQHAQERGAKGIIIYSDPQDVALEGEGPEEVYPNTFWLPGTGIQRGGTYLGDGDPLTPGWPSTDEAYRLKEEEADLATIPTQPIGYEDARIIMEKLGGMAPPEGWVGGMEGIKYNLGPAFLPEFIDFTLKLSTHNYLLQLPNYNVIGTIKGAVEPDRYVLIGNHRDAWGYGASDPSSGTTQILETASVFGKLMKKGWRPRRTIVFCSWGAEEYGLIGSTEWVEEHVAKLQERAVMYVNTDTCASGPMFTSSASPFLWDAIIKVTSMVPGVRGGATIYDEWKDSYLKLKKDAKEPVPKTLGSGSDYAAFNVYAGIPSIDYWFRRDKVKYNISTYAYYHTGYETFYMVSENVDKEFKIHQGCGRVASLTLKYFADSLVLPYSLQRYPEVMAKAIKGLKKKQVDQLNEIYPNFPKLGEAIANFSSSVDTFTANLKNTIMMDPLKARSINDQMMMLERIFIIPGGLPGRITARHAVFAPSQFDGYASSAFPGLADLMYKIDDLQGQELEERKNALRRHISDLTIIVQQAANYLKDFEFI
ncbi:N-acetylated-alpha-linked acidic dipeptidase 2-like [Oratosquilla oratoria]|uniref:N-acetylated-alpha-linked acidic dipeptidase 2-like n=1 Tax=Oratosquilla oratoria TaxID=337810 RepID=UPI003F7583C3